MPWVLGEDGILRDPPPPSYGDDEAERNQRHRILAKKITDTKKRIGVLEGERAELVEGLLGACRRNSRAIPGAQLSAILQVLIVEATLALGYWLNGWWGCVLAAGCWISVGVVAVVAGFIAGMKKPHCSGGKVSDT